VAAPLAGQPGDLYWGNADSVFDLAAKAVSRWTVNGTVNVVRYRRRPAVEGHLGLTADAAAMGLAVATPLFLDADTATFLDDDHGGVTPSWVWDREFIDGYGVRVSVIPANLIRLPVSMPNVQAVTVGLVWAMNRGGAVEGAEVTSGSVTPAAGQVCYVRSASSITEKTAAYTLKTGETAVVGAEWKAAQ